MLGKLLEWFLGALPFFFGLAFLAPLSVQVMAEFGSTPLVALTCGLWHSSFLVSGEA